MSISLYPPSMGSIIPANAALSGGVYASRAVAHPALLWVPLFVEELPALRPGIAGLYEAPPQAVLSAMWAKRWRLDAEVIGAGVTLEVSGEIFDPLGGDTWGSAIADGASAAVTAGVGESPENFVNLSIQISSLNLYYAWSTREWWPGLNVFLQTRDFEAESFEFGTAVIGRDGAIDGEMTDVILTFCGETIPLYYTGSVGPTLSGTIRLTPEDYLDVV